MAECPALGATKTKSAAHEKSYIATKQVGQTMKKGILALTGILLAALMIVASLAAIGQASSSGAQNATASASTSQIVKVGWFGTYIDTLNPFTSYSELTGWINSNVYLPLVNYNSANKTVVPALATSWKLNFSNHTAIFDLNPSAVWSDGTPVTSADVVYSYNIAAQNYSFVASYVSAISSVQALTPHMVMVTFSGVLWTMWAAYIYVVPAHVWSSVDPSTYNGYNQSGSQYFVGDGPFVLTKYVPNQYAQIAQNAKFFVNSEKATVGGVIFQEFTSQSSAVSSLQSGSIQGLSGILPADVAGFQGNGKFTVTTSPSLEYFYLSINVAPYGQGNPTLRNLSVRQAIAHALNLTYITKTIYHGYASTLASVLSPTNQFYMSSLSLYSYNVSLANKMLNDSGFTVYSNGYRENASNTSQKLDYTVLVPSGDSLEIDAANLMAQNLSAIGVKLNVLAETTGSMAAAIWPNMTHDMDLWDWFDNIQSAPQLLSVFLSNQVVTGTSDSGFTNATYDSLWSQLLNATSTAQAQSLSDQMQAILHDQLPYIPLFSPSSINVYSSSITNLTSNYPGGPFGGSDYLTFTQMAYNAPASSGTNNTLYYIIGGVVVIVVVAAVAITVATRRKKQ